MLAVSYRLSAISGQLKINFQFSVFNFQLKKSAPLGATDNRQVWST